MSKVLIVDRCTSTVKLLRSCFPQPDVELIWLSAITDIARYQHKRHEIKVVLFDLETLHEETPKANRLESEPPTLTEESILEMYESISEISSIFQDATIFLLCNNEHLFSSIDARNSGAVGVFHKPLRVAVLQRRLEEFVLPAPVMSADELHIPTSRERVARLVNFTSSSPQQEEMDSIIGELLPVTVEKVMRIQLATSPTFRQMLHSIIEDTVREELPKILKEQLSHQSDEH